MAKPQSSSTDLPNWLIVGFSGHRNLKDSPQVAKLLAAELDQLALSYPRLAGISSAASGADTLFAEEILHRNFPLSVVLPADYEHFSQDFKDDPEGWTRSTAVMRAAIEVDVVQQNEADLLNIAQASSKHQAEEHRRLANLGYMEAVIRIIDRANILIAVWDEQPAKGFGGTADAVAYAIAIELPLVVINPTTGQIHRERFEHLPERPVPIDPNDPCPAPRKSVQAHFETVDTRSKSHAPWARRLIRWYLRLHLLASTIVAIGLVFALKGRWPLIISGWTWQC
jgi:hypothetical protein